MSSVRLTFLVFSSETTFRLSVARSRVAVPLADLPVAKHSPLFVLSASSHIGVFMSRDGLSRS